MGYEPGDKCTKDEMLATRDGCVHWCCSRLTGRRVEMSAGQLHVLLVHNRYRSGQPSGENHVVDHEPALLADAGHRVSRFERRSDDIASMSLLAKASVPLRVADATEFVVAVDAAIIVLSPLGLIRDHLEMVNRLNLVESDVVGYIYKRALRPSHSAGTGVMVCPVDSLARPAWTPRSRPPVCPRRVVRAPGVVVRSPFGPLRSQHRGLA